MKKKCLFLLCTILIACFLCGCSGLSNVNTTQENNNTITAVNLSETELTLTVGDTAALTVSVEPAGIPAANLIWTSDDEKVVMVTDGIVKAVGAGSAVVTVKTENGLTKSCSVTVSEISVRSIVLDATEMTVNEGDTFYITASVTPENVPDDMLTWYSGNNKIAVVTNSGKVTAISAGSVTISCRASNGVEANCMLTVKGSSNDSHDTDNDADKDDDKDNDSDSDRDPNPAPNAMYLDRDPGGHLNPNYRPYESDFVFPYSSVTKLTDSEIKSTLNSMTGTSVSGSFAQDAINEIYARNGYVFKTASIYNYYSAKPWYWENKSFSIKDLNSIETYNVNLLKKYVS